MQDKQAKYNRYDRIKGTLYGVAVGDCLGAPVEFMPPEAIKAKYGTLKDIQGGGWLGVRAGVGTDDTAMTLAVAEGLMKTVPWDHIDPIEKIGAEFIKWFYDAPIGAGAACARAIAYASKNGRVKTPKRSTWLKAAEKAHHDLNGRSGGNGSLMRTAPIALFASGRYQSDLAFDVSKMTHYDSAAAVACIFYCRIIGMLLDGYSIWTAIDIVTCNTEYCWVTQPDYGFMPNPGGYVKDSFNTALWNVTRGCDFEDSLIKVVNLGGDADTTGAITGGMIGAAYGYSAIPKRWIDALDGSLKSRLDAAADAAAIWNG